MILVMKSKKKGKTKYWLLVDEDSGVVVDRIPKTYRIDYRSPEQVERDMKYNEKEETGRSRLFMKVFFDSWENITEYLGKTTKQYGTLTALNILMPYIERDTNYLIRDKKKFKVKDLAELMDISEKQAGIYIKHLKELGLLVTVKLKRGQVLALSPDLVMNGTCIDKAVKTAFDKVTPKTED